MSSINLSHLLRSCHHFLENSLSTILEVSTYFPQEAPWALVLWVEEALAAYTRADVQAPKMCVNS